jgi:hypothetical protein
MTPTETNGAIASFTKLIATFTKAYPTANAKRIGELALEAYQDKLGTLKSQIEQALKRKKSTSFQEAADKNKQDQLLGLETTLPVLEAVLGIIAKMERPAAIKEVKKAA